MVLLSLRCNATAGVYVRDKEPNIIFRSHSPTVGLPRSIQGVYKHVVHNTDEINVGKK